MLQRIACNIKDYQNFFALTEMDLNKRMVEFFSGYNSFNQGMQQRQLHQIISCDPSYATPQEELQDQAKLLENGLQQNFNQKTYPFSFRTFPNFEVMLQHHQKVSHDFFADYLQGTKEGRYLNCTLEQHHFANKNFELVLLHYLFAKAELSLEHLFAHVEAALQLAAEVRIFPLLDANAQHSALLAPLCLLLQQRGFGVELKKVDFEWQMQGHVLLIVREQFCEV